MKLDEGVIKFDLNHNQKEAFSFLEIALIQGVRNRLFINKLIGGKSPEADACYKIYEDVCYGNISMRVKPYNYRIQERQFVITGTQTGCLENLTNEHYTFVKRYYPSENKIVSEGPIQPSSESMTHGMVYDIYHEARAIIHVHSPHIWYAVKEGLLKIPKTQDNIAYGTPEMADEVKRIFRDKYLCLNGLIFSMDGHEDGIISFADTLEKAERLLIKNLNYAKELVGTSCTWK